MRTYSGHTSARASNELYRTNLAKGQTGLSVAFDLPTQTGYDPDHPLARGEVGKVGVPIRTSARCARCSTASRSRDEHVDDDQRHRDVAARMYLALAEEQGVDPAALAGTTQNDIVKEYLSRGTYIFGPVPSRRLTVDVICHTVRNVPSGTRSTCARTTSRKPARRRCRRSRTRWRPRSRARRGARVGAGARRRAARGRRRISFFVNSGIRFVEEMCKMRAFGRLWDRLTAERYGVTDEKLRRSGTACR